MKKLLITLMALLMTVTFTACNQTEVSSSTSETDSSTVSEDASATEEPTVYESGSIIGEGEKHIYVTATDGVNQELIGTFEFYTDAENIGDALLEYGFISGDDSDYGLYVKVVNGVKAEYETDGTYWAFYVNGDLATTGVSSTPVEDEMSYMFQIEEG